ncbi:MarR family winged helix-turn-helix transcriptional regulator [Actinomycetospora endophytica]|uniref:MarR family winged helix-turn-helix transcriptional regulator n=1 Tax=Actinomycetospora endophytica TaxID=2291215 RepID=A0ABS8PAM6_9PSEU|nr:MarR family winged helix-turn-helix transcriptional regulator [Actinomycetospora endophytica]MCD2195299.1 MarR family winged helix-turn-helix transcriptional regulator [Actinomycetospora endophytica]
MSPESRSEADQPLLGLLQRGVRWFSEELLERLEAAGVAPITPAHAAVLAHLAPETPLSIAELARRAGVTRQTMHRAVTQLVDEGLLVSTPGPGFPRSTLIGLTDAGRRRREVASGILHDLEQELGSRLGPGELAELHSTLTRAWPR